MLTIAMLGCGNHPSVVETPMPVTGIALLKIPITPDSPFLRFARKFSVIISAPDMPTMKDTTLRILEGFLSTQIKGIPAGPSRLFEVDVRDSMDSLQYRGFAHADVLADSTVDLTVPIVRIIIPTKIRGEIRPNSKPLAWWSFDTMSGDTFYDVSGHGYDAVSSGLGLVPGVNGKALECPGIDFELIVKNSRDNFYVPKLTIETWFYSNIDPDLSDYFEEIFNYQLIKKDIRNGYSVHITMEGQVAFALSSDSGNYWVPCVSTTAIQPKKWYHIACTYDQLFLKVYINGTLEQSTFYSGNYVNPKADARIGCMQLITETDTVPKWRLNGALDEMKLYDFALSEDSIRAHYKIYNPNDTTRK
jgi:hypothetical protein